MTRELVTGQAEPGVQLGELKPGDQIRVAIDGWHRPRVWEITIISADQVLLFRPNERWITGICQNTRCRVLVRAASGTN